MIFNLVLGDWYQDGNCVSYDNTYDINYPVERLAEAYKTSCRKYGIQFNHPTPENDYIGYAAEYGKGLEDWRYVWCRYGDDVIDATVYVILEQVGILTEDDVSRHNGDYYVEDAAGLVMRFIALSMPADFTYKPAVVPSLNAALHADIGYGLSAI